MNLLKRFLNWLFPKEPAYFYRMDEQTQDPVKVPMDAPAVSEPSGTDVTLEEVPSVDVPLFTAEELKEIKKSDLLELAVNSGIEDVSRKDTKKDLIKKITSYYQIS